MSIWLLAAVVEEVGILVVAVVLAVCGMGLLIWQKVRILLSLGLEV